jgi:hypothetical protein
MEQEERVTDHWVYLVVNASATHVKIGRSDTKEGIKKRLSALQVGHHETLRLIAMLEPEKHDGEKVLHAKFAAQKRNGEWFELKGPVLEFALQHVSNAQMERVLVNASIATQIDANEQRARARQFATESIWALYKLDRDQCIAAICHLISAPVFLDAFEDKHVVEIDMHTHIAMRKMRQELILSHERQSEISARMAEITFNPNVRENA